MSFLKVVVSLTSVTGVGYVLMKMMESADAEVRKELTSREDRNSLTEKEKKKAMFMDVLRAAAENKQPIYRSKPQTPLAPAEEKRPDSS